MLKILEILEERNNSLDIREWKIPTFSNGGGWGLINDVLSNSPLFCGIGGPGKNSSYTGVVLSIRGTSLAPSRSQVNCLESSVLIGSLYFELKLYIYNLSYLLLSFTKYKYTVYTGMYFHQNTSYQTQSFPYPTTTQW